MLLDILSEEQVSKKIEQLQAESASLYMRRQNIEFQMQQLTAEKMRVEMEMLKIDGKSELMQQLLRNITSGK